MHRREAFEWAKDRVKIGHFASPLGYDISGIVHIGASDGYEIQFYLAMGITNIIAIEPLNHTFAMLAESYAPCGVHCIKKALSNVEEERTFYVTQGDGQGSSLLPPTKALKDSYEIIREEKLETIRFDSLLDMMPLALIDLGDYNCLVIDVQGHEFEVLEGMSDCLDNFNFLNIECSEVAIYEGGKTAKEVIAYLKQKGFSQITPTEEHNDILFVRQSVMKPNIPTF